MGKTILWIVIVIVVVGGFYWWWSGRSKSDDMTSTTTTQDTTNTTATDSPDVIPTTAAVTIQNMSFAPGTLTIKKGTVVTWTNQDSMAHTVTSDDTIKANFGSAQLAKGGTYTFTFPTAGTFTYHCSIHPTMKATVVVTE